MQWQLRRFGARCRTARGGIPHYNIYAAHLRDSDVALAESSEMESDGADSTESDGEEGEKAFLVSLGARCVDDLKEALDQVWGQDCPALWQAEQLVRQYAGVLSSYDGYNVLERDAPAYGTSPPAR